MASDIPETVITVTAKATMFSKLTSTLTMAAMLLHSILGCCSHHVHVCEHESGVEDCHSEQDELLSVHAEVAHSEHGHEGHAGCHSVSADSEHRSRVGVNVSREMAEDESKSTPHPEGPCHQDCDGGDCHFAHSSVVKTPSPGDGRLYCPAANAVASSSTVAFGVSVGRASDAGPPGAVAGERWRPMTQVWRL